MSQCQYCGAYITWRRTPNGEYQPYNLDGTIHFPTCRERIAQQRAEVRSWYAELRAQSQIERQEQ